MIQSLVFNWPIAELVNMKYTDSLWYVFPCLAMISLISFFAHQAIVTYDSGDARSARINKSFRDHDKYEAKLAKAQADLFSHEFTDLLKKLDRQLIGQGLTPVCLSTLVGREGVVAQFGTPTLRFAGQNDLFWYYPDAKGHKGLNVLVSFVPIQPEKGTLALKFVYVLTPNHPKASEIKGRQVRMGLPEKTLLSGLKSPVYIRTDTLSSSGTERLSDVNIPAFLLYDERTFYKRIEGTYPANHVRNPFEGSVAQSQVVMRMTPYEKPDGTTHRLVTECCELTERSANAGGVKSYEIKD